jgi:hypothetical protein
VGTSAVTFQLSSDRGIWERLKDILGVNSRIGDVIVTQNEPSVLNGQQKRKRTRCLSRDYTVTFSSVGLLNPVNVSGKLKKNTEHRI